MIIIDSASTKEILKGFHLFQNLNDQQLDTIALSAFMEHFVQGRHLFFQGELLTNVYFMVQGRVRIYRSNKEGKEQTFNLADPGEMFPHTVFTRTEGYPANAVAAQPSKCLVIPSEAFERLIRENPEISFSILQVMAEKIVDLQARLEEKTLYTLEQQLISLLLRLSLKYSSPVDEEWNRFNAQFTNRELAGMLSSTRESVNRCLSKLRKQHMVDVESNGCLLISSVRLRSLLYPVNSKNVLCSDEASSSGG